MSEAPQAQFLREAYHCIKEDPYVEVAMWFNSRDLRGDGSELDSYGLRRADGSRRPAYDAFKDVVPAWTPSPARAATSSRRRCRSCTRRRTSCSATATGCTSARPRRTRTSSASRSPTRTARRSRTSATSTTRTARRWTSAAASRASAGSAPSSCRSARHTIVVTGQRHCTTTRRVVEVPVRKVNPAKLSPQKAAVEALAVGGAGMRRSIRGEVKSGLPFAISGRVRVEWQEQAQGRWKKIHGGSRNAHRPFGFHQTLKYAGQWRVRIVYEGKRPYQQTRSCWVVLQHVEREGPLDLRARA